MIIDLSVFVAGTVVDLIHQHLVVRHSRAWSGILSNSNRAMQDEGSLDGNYDRISVGDSVNT